MVCAMHMQVEDEQVINLLLLHVYPRSKLNFNDAPAAKSTCEGVIYPWHLYMYMCIHIYMYIYMYMSCV